MFDFEHAKKNFVFFFVTSEIGEKNHLYRHHHYYYHHNYHHLAMANLNVALLIKRVENLQIIVEKLTLQLAGGKGHDQLDDIHPNFGQHPNPVCEKHPQPMSNQQQQQPVHSHQHHPHSMPDHHQQLPVFNRHQLPVLEQQQPPIHVQQQLPMPVQQPNQPAHGH